MYNIVKDTVDTGISYIGEGVITGSTHLYHVLYQVGFIITSSNMVKHNIISF